MFTDYRKNLLDKIDAALKKRQQETSTGGNWGQPMGGDWFSRDTNAADADVPKPEDDTPYYTQIFLGDVATYPDDPDKEHNNTDEEEDHLKEASYDANKDSSSNSSEETITKTSSEETTETQPEMPDDMGDGDMGNMGDMTGGDVTNIDGMGGMGGMGEEESKTPEELGKTYELKKIYARLVSVESYLATSSDVNLLKLRNYVSQSIELFSVIIANVDSYKDKVDEIIVKYYEFLDLIYIILSQYYDKKEKEEEEENKGRAI